jgi:hypothetical protein
LTGGFFIDARGYAGVDGRKRINQQQAIGFSAVFRMPFSPRNDAEVMKWHEVFERTFLEREIAPKPIVLCRFEACWPHPGAASPWA